MKADILNLSEIAAPWSPAGVRRVPLPRVLYGLVLDPSKKFGSMEEQIVLLAERFRAEGSLFLPLFICDPDADLTQFRQRGIDAHCLELSRFSWSTLRNLGRLLRTRRIDLVHWNFMPPLTNRYVWALSLLAPRVRHWFTDHNSRLLPLPPPPAGAMKFVKRLLLRRYSRAVCVSRYVQECLEAQGVWSNLVCIRHFINTERFQPDAAVRRQLRTTMNADDHFVLLVVGQLIKEKGVDVAVRALAELPSVRLWVVGEGPEEEALRRLIAELRLEERVQLLGLQRHVQPYLQAADCFVCPSLWGEAAGLVNLEAQSCGTPVIASRIGGIPEYVADDRTGLLFPPGDHQALAHCIRRLVEDAELQRRFVAQARTDALEHFSPQARIPEYLDLYRRWKGPL
jgi:glycosyltransferase involved in cell wall biosynthesis